MFCINQLCLIFCRTTDKEEGDETVKRKEKKEGKEGRRRKKEEDEDGEGEWETVKKGVATPSVCVPHFENM